MRKVYKVPERIKRCIEIEDNIYTGESIEQMLRRVKDGETIEMGTKPLLYSERKYGVIPESDIRQDRMDLARDAMDYASRMDEARRRGMPGTREELAERQAKAGAEKNQGGETGQQ